MTRVGLRPAETAIARVAERQHGVISRQQLTDLGFGPGAIAHRIAAGRLHRVHRGVYAAGHPRLSRHGHWMAAVLACGPDALLSHSSAAVLWDLLRTAERRIDVTVVGNRRCRRGIFVHRAHRLHREDRTERNGISVTSIARTLLDLAGVIRLRQLERAVDQAERMQVFDLRAIERLRKRSPRRRGLAILDHVLAHYLDPAPTRSELERQFLDLCRKAGLPPPAVNSFIAGFEVDVAWPDHRLAVELDSYGYHRTRLAFERDRVRDSVLQVSGYRVMRVTHRRLENEPAQVLKDLRSLLGLGS